MKRSSTTSVSRFFLETLVVASNDAGLAKATIDLGLSDVGRRHVGLDPSLSIVLSCAGMRSPRRPKLRSPCCAYDEGRDYWDLAALAIQTFRTMRCSRAQAGRLHTTCVLGMAWRRQESCSIWVGSTPNEYNTYVGKISDTTPLCCSALARQLMQCGLVAGGNRRH